MAGEGDSIEVINPTPADPLDEAFVNYRDMAKACKFGGIPIDGLVAHCKKTWGIDVDENEIRAAYTTVEDGPRLPGGAGEGGAGEGGAGE